jgi:hypothetical protein
LGVEHIIKVGYAAVGIGDDGELDSGVADVVDVFNPFLVRRKRICGL